ncbi:MAG: M50 family metallopeptidase [Oscillospiraceae bacterium]|jgi:stage IV sporulation protein FB|nr:M50 family metallopeptidase [Oscillospiraceae bacterium]
MGRAARLGSVGGVDIRMHAAFPVLIISSFLLGQWPVTRVTLLALCLHECSHALAAKALGMRVVSLELTPFGGIARVEGLGHAAPWQEVAVAMAGPGSNLLMAMGAGFGAQMGLWPGEAVQMFVRCNLALMLCNLMPALPLDGGRAVRAMASGALGWRRSTRVFAWFGAALGAGLVALGVYEAFNRRINPTFFMTGAYLVYAALEERDASASWIAKGLSGRASQFASAGVVPARWYAASADTPVSRLPARVSQRGYTMVVALDPVGMRPLGTIHESELMAAMMDDQRVTVGELIKRREPAAVDVTARARDAVWRVAREGSGIMTPTRL